MLLSFILIPGPPVRATSWEPTADQLRRLGHTVQVPDVLARSALPPSWRTWTDHLLKQVCPSKSLIVVGHSSACALAIDLATKVAARGVILVDGDIPPTSGAAAPIRPALRDFLATLADPTGLLPIWSRWFMNDPARAALVGVDVLQRNRDAYDRFERGLPRLKVDWFKDEIQLDRWDHISAGYIQTSKIYDHATAEARRRNWPIIATNGTHLDPALRPVEMSEAIVALTTRIAPASAACVGKRFQCS